MSKALIDFLRSSDEPQVVGEDEAVPGERTTLNIFNDQYVQFDPDEDLPTEDVSWVLPVLYKLGAHGDMTSYQIGYNHISKKLLWIVGRVETGGMTLYNIDVIPTRAQKGSFQKKAFQDAMARYGDRLKKGFHREIGGTSELARALPMLANKYRPPGEEESGMGNSPHLPVAAQAKIDGERHMVTLDAQSGTVRQLTRLMNMRPHFTHIQKEAARLLEFLPPGTFLDGELWSETLGFQMITSIAGSKTEPHPRETEVDYYVFDIYHPSTVWRPGISKQAERAHAGDGDRVEGAVYARASGYTVENYSTEVREYYELPHDETGGDESLACIHYSEFLIGNPMWVVELRVALLMNAFRCYAAKYNAWPKHIKLVKTFILHQREDIQKLFGEMRRLQINGPEKLEGIMLRQLSRGDANPLKSLYRPGRSDNLLKVKGLQTTEVLITGVRAGKGRAKDLATLTYKEPGTGIVGTVVPAATHDQRRHMLLHPESVKGRTMTVSFQNRMQSGALRFPVGIIFLD